MKVPVQVVFKSKDNKYLRYTLHREFDEIPFPFFIYFIVRYRNFTKLNMFYSYDFNIDSCYKLGLRGYIKEDWKFLRGLIHGKT